MTISYNYSHAPLHQPVDDVEWFAWFVNLVKTINKSLGGIGSVVAERQRAPSFWFDGSVWTNMTSSRAVDGTSYQNTLTKPICVSVIAQTQNHTNNFELYVSDNNSTWIKVSRWTFPRVSTNTLIYTAFAIVPSKHYYRASGTNLSSLQAWVELR